MSDRLQANSRHLPWNRPRGSRLKAQVAVFGVTLLVAGCSPANISFLHPQGPVAASQRHLFFLVIAWMMVVVIPVFALGGFFAWRYRRGNAAARYSPGWNFSWPLEVAIWGVPFAIVGVLAYLIWTEEGALDPYAPLASNKPPTEIEVVGLDWKWLFVYPKQHVATVGEVAFPADRPVHFRLTSDTVMQSFFIPALGSQIYAMAGMVTQLNLQATHPGTAMGENTQFNGMGFQEQQFVARAMAPASFSNWVAEVRKQGRPLDRAAFDVLARKSTMKNAHAELGSAKMPATAIYFSNVPSNFFAGIVHKYNPGVTVALGANRAKTRGHHD